jgi:hypothetical protein
MGGDGVGSKPISAAFDLHFCGVIRPMETYRRGLGPGPERGGSSSLPARTKAVGQRAVKRAVLSPKSICVSDHFVLVRQRRREALAASQLPSTRSWSLG